MSNLACLGSLLLVAGISLVVWGVVEMSVRQDAINHREAAGIMVDYGRLPLMHTAGVILGSMGLIFIVVGSVRQRTLPQAIRPIRA